MSQVATNKKTGLRYFVLDKGPEYTWLGPKMSTRDCFKVPHQQFKEEYESEEVVTTVFESIKGLHYKQ